ATCTPATATPRLTKSRLPSSSPRAVNAFPMTTAVVLCTVLLAYLVGSIPFGYLVARSRGVDILKQGSGNIGATNVGRVLGRRFGVLIFLLDAAKGGLPVLLAGFVPEPPELPPNTLRVAAGAMSFLGPLFPIYL